MGDQRGKAQPQHARNVRDPLAVGAAFIVGGAVHALQAIQWRNSEGQLLGLLCIVLGALAVVHARKLHTAKLNGCNRVAEHEPHNNSKRPDLHVFKEFTKRSRLAVVVDSFMARLPRTAVLKRSKDKDGSYFYHARAVSFVWAFADDFFVRIRCEPGLHQSTVEMQGQLRIGDGDMDVNWSRNEALLEALHEAQNRGELPSEDSC